MPSLCEARSCRSAAHTCAAEAACPGLWGALAPSSRPVLAAVERRSRWGGREVEIVPDRAPVSPAWRPGAGGRTFAEQVPALTARLPAAQPALPDRGVLQAIAVDARRPGPARDWPNGCGWRLSRSSLLRPVAGPFPNRRSGELTAIGIDDFASETRSHLRHRRDRHGHPTSPSMSCPTVPQSRSRTG